ncbi:hypothetical protein NDU88_004593 [Pleurodeles waltl]|uniref:Uncharacterized protein n=1 Tax=Pleurodeles waltl TaxID=8319 RepID=A0AAV7SJB6_PLEWA|nr:hypothetical protein NDU88_004593 [Pleurodeles waltl]
MDQTLTDSQKTDGPPCGFLGSRQQLRHRRGRRASDRVLRTKPTAHWAKESQRKTLMLAATLKVRPRCPSVSSLEGSVVDSDTDGSMALFPSMTPQTAHDL